MREIYGDPERFTANVAQWHDPSNEAGKGSVPMGVDPPVHTKYRRLINTAFAPRLINALSEDVRTFAIELIEAVRHRGKCDFAREVAEPFPVTIFLRLAGLPVSELATFRAWIKQQFHAKNSQEQAAAMGQIVAYLAGVMQERRKRPGDDIFSVILQGQIDGRPLNDEEMLSMALTHLRRWSRHRAERNVVHHSLPRGSIQPTVKSCSTTRRSSPRQWRS